MGGNMSSLREFRLPCFPEFENGDRQLITISMYHTVLEKSSFNCTAKHVDCHVTGGQEIDRGAGFYSL